MRVTDGYALSGHEANGEHPVLQVDENVVERRRQKANFVVAPVHGAQRVVARARHPPVCLCIVVVEFV